MGWIVTVSVGAIVRWNEVTQKGLPAGKGTDDAGNGLRRDGVVMTAKSWRSLKSEEPRNENPLSIGAGVWWADVKPSILKEVIGQRYIKGRKALEQIAAPKGHTEPEAFSARLGQKISPVKAFGVDAVLKVEFANVTNMLYIIDGSG